jgi:LuxR family maltose regulon positive regulatory protein
VEAIRHAQAAQDWGMAVRLLADHWPGLQLGGRAASVHAILARFPAEAPAADAELAALVAADELAQGSLEAAEQHLEVAAQGSASVPTARRGQWQVLLGILRLLLARQRGNLQRVAEEARRLQAMAEASEVAESALGEELRALALISLGIAEIWAARLKEAGPHLEQGVVLARRIGRPFWSSPAWRTRRRSSSSARSRGPRSAACKRPSWPNDTAGPASRPPAPPT